MLRGVPVRILAALLLLAPLRGFPATDVGAELAQADAIRSTNPQQFQRILKELELNAAQATPAQSQLLRYLQAYQLAYEGKYDLAIRDATTLFGEAHDSALRFRAGLLVVNSSAATRQFDDGLRFLDKTLELRPLVSDRNLLHQGLNVAGIFYNQLGQFEIGRRYATQVLAEQPNARNRCLAGHIEMESLTGLVDSSATDEAFIRVIDQCSSQGEGVIANLVRADLARKWLSQGKTAQAIVLLESHLAEIEATRYPRLIGEIKSLLAQLHMARAETAIAEANAKAAVAASSGTIFALPVVMAYRILYEISLARNDFAQALDNYRHYAEADKAYLNDVKARELAYQHVRQETLQKNQMIELLEGQNKVLHLEQQVAKQQTKNTLLFASLLALLLASIAYRAYKIKRVQVAFRRLAETDALTGISNRHHFGRQAEAVLAICSRSGQDVGMVMFDLDNFKTINDRFGHATGDWVLKQVAVACRALCRPNDLIGRVGGEEFAILLRGCSLDATMSMAQACCEAIAAIDSAPSGYVFPISASFGVASAAISGYDFASLLTRADHAMYSSKRGGRNRVSSDQEIHQGVLS